MHQKITVVKNHGGKRPPERMDIIMEMFKKIGLTLVVCVTMLSSTVFVSAVHASPVRQNYEHGFVYREVVQGIEIIDALNVDTPRVNQVMPRSWTQSWLGTPTSISTRIGSATINGQWFGGIVGETVVSQTVGTNGQGRASVTPGTNAGTVNGGWQLQGNRSGIGAPRGSSGNRANWDLRANP